MAPKDYFLDKARAAWAESTNTHDAAHWRERAAEMRALSEGERNWGLQQQLRLIASGYDRLAERANG